jgi:NAD(P)-dependent dehydrogenase (short-subunit alcohol dehydrogenase family)
MDSSDYFAGMAALIIGGGQNIGRAVALEWAKRGARLAVADLNADGAEETAALIRAAGGVAVGLAVDVTEEASVAAAIAGAQAALGPLDILMNNAGLIHSGNPEDFPPAEWQRLFNVNFFGAVRANAIVLPAMLARGRGHIVNTASFAGLYPYATNRIPYAASKAALVSMSENMAIYAEPLGVRVSCLCPGPTMTTSTNDMKPWSEHVIMRGPGSDLAVNSQEQLVVILSDAMAAGRILIPTHDAGYGTMQSYAADPDAFIRAKAADFAAGRSGRPGQ